MNTSDLVKDFLNFFPTTFSSKDSKSNPNSSFSASVNLGSSKYFKQSINQVNIGLSLTFLDDISDNCRWDLWYELCITKRLKVATVLEHSR